MSCIGKKSSGELRTASQDEVCVCWKFENITHAVTTWQFKQSHCICNIIKNFSETAFFMTVTKWGMLLAGDLDYYCTKIEVHLQFLNK